ncbi:glutathione S-transferase family protein [Ferrovibrio sp.]|uniref:glutathione S-transferase family protein n=1 Tax=Ferrovibrio sp. TaxID=1917215 RepID=UPI00351724A7
MQRYDLISNDLCPYTQRAAIQLAEKGVPFTRTYIDLADRPDWFQQISPLGKVPVLRVGEAVVFESAVICEYIEETAPGRALHPADPLARAQQRGWIEYASAIIADVFGFYMAPDRTAFERKRGDLQARFRRLEGGLGAGPWFSGADFGLVDAAFAPIFRLFDGFDRIGAFGILDDLPKVAAYRAALAGRDSVRDAVVPDYQARFLRYLAGRGSHLAGLAAQQVAA